MKLLLCTVCQDVVKLWALATPRYCKCGQSYGRYVDERKVIVGGPCHVLGLNNVQMDEAWEHRDLYPDEDQPNFNAFFLRSGSHWIQQDLVEVARVKQDIELQQLADDYVAEGKR